MFRLKADRLAHGRSLNYYSKALSHFHQENGIINILNILLILSKSPSGGR